MSADWYYVGHFGQLGPLTFEQVSDLVSDGVIDRETYVWKSGMVDWILATDAADLKDLFPAPSSPPPPPTPTPGPKSRNLPADRAQGLPPGYATQPVQRHYPYGGTTDYSLNLPVSDKSRGTAAVLNLIPGFGRFYLGYSAHGLLQFMTSLCAVGIIWSWVDAVYILAGGVKLDGYGRRIRD